MLNILNKFFEKIYVITCVDFNTRHKFIKQQFKKFKIDFSFFIAPEQYLFVDNILSRSEQSLLYAHKECIVNAKINGYKNILICEDDVLFKNKPRKNFKEFIQVLPNDWDAIQLGNQLWASKWLHREKIKDNLYRFYHGTGSHCIGINQKAYNNMISSLESNNNPADFAYYEMYKELKCYSPENFIADAISKQDHLNHVQENYIFDSTIHHKNV